MTYLDLWVEGKNIPGPLVNYGTWESVVYAIAHVYELSAIRKQLFPEKLPTFKPKVKPRYVKIHLIDHSESSNNVRIPRDLVKEKV